MNRFHDKLMENAHERFQVWRSQNEDGFVLNWKSTNNVTLHRVHCPHLGDTKWSPKDGLKGWGDMGKVEKVCSSDKQILEKYARDHGTSDIKYCRDCAP